MKFLLSWLLSSRCAPSSGTHEEGEEEVEEGYHHARLEIRLQGCLQMSSGMSSSSSSIVPSPPGVGRVMCLQGTRLPLTSAAGANSRRRRLNCPMAARRLD